MRIYTLLFSIWMVTQVYCQKTSVNEVDSVNAYYGEVQHDFDFDLDYIIRLIPVDDTCYYETIASADGKFIFENVEEGNYIIHATIEQYSSYQHPDAIPTYYPDALFWNEAANALIGQQNMIHLIEGDLKSQSYNLIYMDIRDPNNYLEYAPTALILNNSNNPIRSGQHYENLQYLFEAPPMGYVKIYPQYLGKTTIPFEYIFEDINETPLYVTFIATENSLVPLTTSIVEAKNDLTIYPNPTSDRCFISCNIDIKKLRITDLNGKNILKRTNINKSEYIFNVEAISPGVYFITIETPTEVFTQKLIIK